MTHAPIRLPGKRSKYGAVRTNGFASKAESRRYDDLVLMQRAGMIAELKTQVRFMFTIGSVDICSYIADFQYVDLKTGKMVTEDCKGYKTPEYKIKKRLMLAVYGIEIFESK